MNNERPKIELLGKEALQALALALDRILNGEDKPDLKRANGFVLMVFPFRDKSAQCHYVSNGASREDIIRLFKEQLRQLEGVQPEEQPMMSNGDGPEDRQMSETEIAANMSKVNSIMHDLRDGKLTREEAHEKLVGECHVADQGLDKLLDAYDPKMNQ